MRKVRFDGVTINNVIEGCYTLSVDPPIVPPKFENKVAVPGRNYSWDFGGHTKQDFTITVVFHINIKDGGNLDNKVALLASILETDEKRPLEIDGLAITPVMAQIYGGVRDDRHRTGQYTEVTVTFTCREETEQD